MRRASASAVWCALGLTLALALCVWGVKRLTAQRRRSPTPTAVVALARLSPTPLPHPPTAVAPSPTVATPPPTAAPLASSTLPLWERLERVEAPARDDRALALELGRVDPAALAVTLAPAPWEIGDSAPFWVGDADTAVAWQITATLRVELEHVQMWVEEGAEVAQEGLLRSARVFEEHIYPAVRALFGSEATPGIDGDAHLVVLNAYFRGASGYFSAANQLPQALRATSNQREMFVMSLYDLTPGTDSYESTLAHEFQHMVHWNLDANEEGWLQEGCSALAQDLLGYAWPAWMADGYAAQPDVQLNAWTDDPSAVASHYGAAFLFVRYLYDRLGAEALYTLANDGRNGLASVEAALQRAGAPGLDALYADWLVANALDDDDVSPGRYGYDSLTIDIAPRARVASLPLALADDVAQYGADYYAVDPAAVGPALRIAFVGEPETRLVPVDAASSSHLWWSNWGDGAHTWLERTFDLSAVTTATLDCSLWYDIERGWDYAYVRASGDGGASWQWLRGAHMSTYDPSGGALGPGYTGLSGVDPEVADGDATWIRESYDLSAYCGGQVTLRFDYVTDDAYTRAGLCVDDLEVAALGWSDDSEQSEAGWRAAGFVRHDNALPQRYLLQWVTRAAGSGAVDRQVLEVDSEGRGTWTAQLGADTAEAWLIVSATTPWSRQAAPYRLEVAPTEQRDVGSDAMVRSDDVQDRR
ncbi:MAG: hypothetical protein GX557_14270 [Chloroflexi bacterium]|nr:hypothetical protein [Chloroflexota bacterium]